MCVYVYVLGEVAGIRLREGKARAWNCVGICPPRLDDLGPHVWSPSGVKVSGTPVDVRDVQCAWQLVFQCAISRASHVLRTVPPSWSAQYAEAHDSRVWAAACRAVGRLPDTSEERLSSLRGRASLPMRLGGLGLRSAARTTPAAY